MTATARLALIALVSALLAACGGGSGGSDALTPIGGDDEPTGESGADVFVSGTVTGFGSVIVDGQRFATEAASIEVGGAPGTEADLRVGQGVEVTGDRDADGNLRAANIRYRADVKGPVQELDVDAGILVVAGQTVQTGVRTRFEDMTLDALSVGDLVEVSGRRDGRGVIFARYIERDDDLEVGVKGPVANLDADMRTFRIGGLQVDYGNASLDPSDLVLENGRIVEVEGSLSGETLLASEIEAEEDLGRRLEAGAEVEIEGLIEDLVGDDGFILRGLHVRYNAATEFDDGGPDNLAVGVAVEVEGRLDDSGVLIATEIEFEDFDERDSGVEFEAFVTAVNEDSIELLGVTIAVDNRTRVSDDRDDIRTFRLADLVVGDFVEVGAIQREDALLAVRIEREDDEDAVEVDGVLQSFDAATRSLVVSGVTVDGSSAEFDLDGGRVSAEQFFMLAEVGSRVEVEGSYDGAALIATEIDLDRRIDVEIEARIQHVNEDSVQILGITLVVDELTRLSDDRDDVEPFALTDLAEGDFVEVEAIRVNDTLVAVRIEREDDDDEVELVGFLDSLNAEDNSMVVSGVLVDVGAADFDLNGSSVTAAMFFEQAEIGATVEVEGSFDGERLIATEVELDD